MSSKNKYGKFTKKEYLRTIRGVRNYLCEKFGYTLRPYLFETQLHEDELMCFYHCKAGCAILYDYKGFKNTFGHKSFDLQKVYAAAITAHEMRHYYQHRQMSAAKPIEDEKTLALWRENERVPKGLDMKASEEEYYAQPLELDASLFEYVFGAEQCGFILLQSVANEGHLNAMEKLYVEYFGETDEGLFNEEIRETLRSRERDAK
jgi:hypothetical protein